MMPRQIRALLLLACLVGPPAFAVGPVLTATTCRLQWKAPVRNADQTLLRNLLRYEVFISMTKGKFDRQHPTARVEPPSTRVGCPDSVRNTNGQYWAMVTAVDTSGHVSVISNQVAFMVHNP